MAGNVETDVKDTALETTAQTESSTAENETSGAEDLFSEEDSVSAETNDTAKETEQNTEAGESEPARGAERRKMQLNSEIRDKVAERNALRAEIAELNRQRYQTQTNVPTVDSLIDQVNPETGDYYTRVEAELAQIRAERELEKEQRRMDEYTNQIVESNMRLIDESERVLRDFPMFDPESSEFNAELSSKADQLLENALVRDQNTGRIIGSQISPYALYSTIAAVAGTGKVQGEIAGRKASAKMMSATDVVGSGVAENNDEDDPFVQALMS